MTPDVLSIVAALTAAYWLSLAVRAYLRRPPLPSLPYANANTNSDRPLVSIVVAVRNEMNRVLVDSISSCLAQDHPAVEVIAVDDHSEDDSRATLQRLAAGNPRLRVVDAPSGGHGKRAALVTGAEAARGSWLLFTDADAQLTGDAVRRGVTYAIDQRIDALSLLPRTMAVSLAEQTALAAVSWLVYEGGQLRRCNRDTAPVGLAAAGPYLLVSRAAFDAIGGYAAIRQNVLIDVALARRLRAGGFRYRYLRSDGCVATRMYRSLSEIWHGFGKNAYLALGDRIGLALMAITAATTLTLAPAIVIGAGLAFGSRPAFAFGVAAYLAMLTVQHRGGRFMGTRLGPAALILAPIGALLWLAIVAQSAWRTRAQQTVLWKGRALPVFDRVADR